MAKPTWYEDTKVSTPGGESLKPGGHRCIIKNIEAMKSKTGLDMYKVYFDTDHTDEQPGYYLERWNNDTRPDKSWAGCTWLVIDENAKGAKGDEYGKKNFKTLMTALENSNAPIRYIDWNLGDYRTPTFLNQFTNWKVGIVFRQEEYTKEDHTVGMSVKPMYFRSYDKVEESKIPKLKEAPKTEAAPAWAPAQGASGANGFMHLTDDLADEGLPFNV